MRFGAYQRLGLRFAVLLVAAAAAVPCFAATDRYWTGSGGDGAWFNTGATNWTAAGAPTNGTDDSVYFLSTGDYDPNPNNNVTSPPFSLKKLTFNSGAATTIRLVGNALSVTSGGGVYQNSANSVRIDNSLSWTSSLTLKSQGAGGLILGGGLSTGTSDGRVTVGLGSVVFSTGTFGTGNSGDLRVGDTAPASLTIQDSATLNVGGELDVNYACTLATPSVLTLKSGSLNVTGQTTIGRAGLRTDPSNISAAFYQSGGTASLTGLMTVGYNGTATSLYDINGGTLNANGGLLIGAGGTTGNGAVSIHGSGVVNVTGGSGLVIGQDDSLATSGGLSLSGGALTIGTEPTPANLTLGNGGLATFSRSGGTMTAWGNLVIGGVGTLTIDDTTGPMQTAFSGTLTRGGNGTLVLVPQNGHLSGNERVTFGAPPSSPNGIIGAWLVAQTSASDSRGTHLTCPSGQLANPAYSNRSGSHTTVANELLNVTGTATITDNGDHAWIMRVGPYTTTLANTVTLGSGGVILNGGPTSGGTITGGTLAFGSNQALIYAGSSDPAVIGGTIESAISGSQGLLKFGPGTLVLDADNSTTLTAPGSGGVTVLVASGTMRVQNAGALGAVVDRKVVVGAGASLELQGDEAGMVVDNHITLNGGGGALCNTQGNNTLNGTLTVASNSLVNTDGGILTLNGPLEGTFDLRKTGGNMLVLSGSSAFSGSLTIASNVVRLQSNHALGTENSGASATVNNGTTLQLQGGISIPNVSLTLSGAGTTNNGALQNLLNNNAWAGAITLATDSLVNVDRSSDTLTLSGAIGGDYGLTKAGSGTLLLSGTSTFGGGLNVLDGALKLSTVNDADASGPLGASTIPVVLGSSGKTGTLWYTGATVSTDRSFWLAANGEGNFSVDSESATLTLSAAVGGNGNLVKTGKGTLTLTAANAYDGTTTINGGALVLSGASGSLASASVAIFGTLTLSNANSANNSDRIGNNAPINLGGVLNFNNDASANNFSEVLGRLNVIGAGAVNSGQAASDRTSTLVFNGIAHSAGGTVNFPGTDLGANTRNTISIVGQASGFIGGCSRCMNEWAKYGQIGTTGTYSVMPFVSGDYTAHAETAWVIGDHVKLPSGNTTAISAASRTTSSLNMTPTGAATTLNIPDGDTLHIAGLTGGDSVGGILISGSYAATIAASGANHTGAITAGLSNHPGELVVHQNSTQKATISAVIADNGSSSYPVTLVKSGAGTLALSGANSYTGGTIVAEGQLEVTAIAAIPSGTSLTINGGGTVVLSSGLSAAGAAGAAAAVPEPGTVVLLLAAMIGATAVGVRRPRRSGFPA